MNQYITKDNQFTFNHYLYAGKYNVQVLFF